MERTPARRASGSFHRNRINRGFNMSETVRRVDDDGLDVLPPPPSATAFKATGPFRATLPRVAGFDVLCELGRGGLGRVDRARELGLNRMVAIKMLHAAE